MTNRSRGAVPSTVVRRQVLEPEQIVVERARQYAGPTKRSADVDDYTALESQVARLNDEVARLRAEVDVRRKGESALLMQIRRLEAASGVVDVEEAASFADVRRKASKRITPTTPIGEIEAALEYRRRAIRIADRVVDAVLRSTTLVTDETLRNDSGPGDPR